MPARWGFDGVGVCAVAPASAGASLSEVVAFDPAFAPLALIYERRKADRMEMFTPEQRRPAA